MLRSNRLRPWLIAALPDGDGGPGDGGGGGGPKPADPRTFTQEEVTAVATRAKSEARTAALKEAAERLGMPIEDAEKAIKAQKDAEDKEKTDAQRAKDEAEAEKAAAAKEKTEAAAEKHRTRTERLLVRAGLDVADEKTAPDNLDDALALLGKLEPDATDDQVKEAVDKLKTRRPELFAAADQTRQPGSGDPGPAPRKPAGGKSPVELGMETGRSLFGVPSDNQQKTA